MMQQTLTEYEKGYKNLFQRVNSLSISLKNSFVICRRCQTSLTKEQYLQHSKNCKRHTQKNTSKLFDISKDNTIMFENAVNEIPSPDDFYNNLISSVLGFIKTGVQQLLINTKYLKRGVVLKILGKKCINFASTIPQIIDENDYRSLISDKFMSEVLKSINDIFQPTLVQSRISKFSENRKTRIRKKLNTYLKSLDMDPLYIVQKKEHKFERSKLPLMFRELSSFVLKLISTKQKKYVHLALDLLIIYHSMQRFPSSMDLVRVKVKQILQKYQDTQLTFGNIEKTTKTKQKVTMYLNKQLIKWLIEFQWKQFAFNYRFYERFTQNFNFSMYSLRRGIITQAKIFKKAPDDKEIAKLTNHVSIASVGYYLVGLESFQNKQFHQSLQVQNDDFLKNKYARYSNMDRIFPKIYKPLNSRSEYYELSITNAQFKQTLQFHSIPINQVQRNEAEAESQSEESLSNPDSKIQEIEIEGLKFKLNQGIFCDSIFFQQKSLQNCRVCFKGSTTMICIFCLKAYHIDCIPQFCPCMKINSSCVGILANGAKTQSEMIQMPAQYFDKNAHLMNSFRKLIHMRGFYFTTCATLFEAREIASPNFQKASQFSFFPNYQKYQAGHYFPPLILGKSGDQNSSGSGIGVFCCKNINANVFIGQYGGDILSQDQMIFIKRRDMSMLLTEVNDEKFYVGCVKHCSYVQLVNCSKQKANCQIRLVVVNKKMKLLLYTVRQIVQGEQLLYYYGQGFSLSCFKSGLREKIYTPNTQQVFQTKKKENQNQVLQIQNIQERVDPLISQTIIHFTVDQGQKQNDISNMNQNMSELNNLKKFSVEINTNTCYAQCLFMLYRYFYEYFIEKDSDLAQEIRKKKINPKKFVSMFRKFNEENSNKKSQIFCEENQNQNTQQDIMQFYYYLQQNILEGGSPFHEMTTFQSKQCLICQRTESKYISDKQWYVDMSNNNIALQIYTQVQVQCLSCKENTNHKLFKQLKSTPQLLILAFKRNGKSSNAKLKYAVDLNKFNSHNGAEYALEVVVVHVGEFTSSGHYKLYFPKYHCVFDRNKWIESNEDFQRDVYIAIFSKKSLKKSKARKHNMPSSQVGIFINIKERLVQNYQKCYKIASIVKLITYLVCQKLRQQLGIQLDHNFIIPRIQVYGLNSVLKQHDKVSLQQLYQLMLVCSSADAAASLGIIFGNALKQTKSNLLDYNPTDIFINQMADFCRRNIQMMNTVIKDPCGLKSNLSTIQDLLLLLQYIKQNEILIKILRKPSIIFQSQILENTNQLHKICVGKTGTHKTGYCFVGLYGNKPLICLDFKTKKSMFHFLEDTIRSQTTEKILKKQV